MSMHGRTAETAAAGAGGDALGRAFLGAADVAVRAAFGFPGDLVVAPKT
jgi:hypothetical protein